MQILTDYRGFRIRLTQERIEHVLEHPEMRRMAPAIRETLAAPKRVVQSRSDETVQLYYRYYRSTPVGEKFLCVVVKQLSTDAFVVTAYLTDSIKAGATIWPVES